MYKLLRSSEDLQSTDTHPSLKLLLNYHKVKNSEPSTPPKELKPGNLLITLGKKKNLTENYETFSQNASHSDEGVKDFCRCCGFLERTFSCALGDSLPLKAPFYYLNLRIYFNCLRRL